MICPKCNSIDTTKYGKVLNQDVQKFVCKNCSFQFTTKTSQQMDHKSVLHRNVLILYLSGLSYRIIADKLKISHAYAYKIVQPFNEYIGQSLVKTKAQNADIKFVANYIRQKQDIINYKILLVDMESELLFIT